MEQRRQAIVQLCFRSTYSLNYQPFRRSQAGEISLCEDIDAYEVNSTYRTSLDNHLMMMDGSLAKSFGAREEVRGSGTSIRQVIKNAAELVSNAPAAQTKGSSLTFSKMRFYRECAGPILPVKSDLYFGFQIRRMKELRNVQMHMAKYRPENYGTITSVLMHMTRHIAHSPEASTGYLKDALQELRFYTVMERFGTFFLHEMDLEHATVLQINEQDSEECLLAMSRFKSFRKIKEARPVEVAIMADQEPTEQFPIGNAPTWEEISLAIAHRPMLLMWDWVWDEKWATRSTAGRLFLQFTIDYFLTLTTDALKVAEFPKPCDLKGAMEQWTMPSLMTVLKDVSFKPSNHGLKGHMSGRRNPSFKDLMSLFFPIPDPNMRKDSVWHPFLAKGYLHEFHEMLHGMSEKESSSLLLALKKIFGRLQCLPSAVACSRRACGRLWEQFDGGVRMLTNPIFYKIEMVGKAKRKGTARGKQVKASKAIIEARLDEEHRHIAFNKARLKARQAKKARNRETKRRSGKKNNYRKPPAPRQKKAATCSEESSEDQVARSSDEWDPLDHTGNVDEDEWDQLDDSGMDVDEELDQPDDSGMDVDEDEWDQLGENGMDVDGDEHM